jgi:HupE/UreJ protein
VLGLPSCARAHTIPNDAKIQTFLKPDGQRLRVLVRVPLETMVDIEYPTRGASGEFVDLDHAERSLRELAGLWIADNIESYEGGRQLPYPQIVDVRASLAFDGSFASYEQALAHVTGPRLTNSVDFVWNQGLLDVLLEYPIQSDRSQFSVHSKLSTLALRTTTSLQFLVPDGGTRAFEFMGDPGLIMLDPTRYQTAARFIRTGFLEILGGVDYWLFLLVLVMPLRRPGALVPVAIAFAVAQAITLSPSSIFAPDALWFQPLIGTLIAISIVYMAIENGLGTGQTRRWMMAFGFGLVLGFDFSFALRQTLQFAGTHPLTSLASFGAGVDLGQLLLLVVLVPAVQLLFRLVTERAGTFVVSLMAGDVAWHWTRDRADLLRRYQFQWPAMTPALMLKVVGWATDLVIAAAVFWLLLTAIRRFTSRHRASEGAIADAKR